MQQSTVSTNEFKKSLIIMLISALVAVGVTVPVTLALIKKFQPHASAASDAPANNKAAAGPTVCPEPTSQSATAGGAQTAPLPALATLPLAPTAGGASSVGLVKHITKSNTTVTKKSITTETRNSDNVVSVSDNKVDADVLSNNTVEALNDNTILSNNPILNKNDVLNSNSLDADVNTLNEVLTVKDAADVTGVVKTLLP